VELINSAVKYPNSNSQESEIRNPESIGLSKNDKFTLPLPQSKKDKAMNNGIFRKVLLVVAWIIFLGLCIEAGGFLTNTIYALFFNSDIVHHFWNYLDLSALYEYSESQFVMVACIISITSILKALMFYLIVKILHENKIKLSAPFNAMAEKFIERLAYLSLGIGIFAYWGEGVIGHLVLEGINVPSLQDMRLGGADVWIFMGVILLINAQIFKRGSALQAESDLTI
jgi:hypothetical protein